MAERVCPLFCVCDYCTAKVAAEHAAGDECCGRAWSCACGACRRARVDEKVKALFGVVRGFARAEAAEAELARLRAVRRLARG